MIRRPHRRTAPGHPLAAAALAALAALPCLPARGAEPSATPDLDAYDCAAVAAAPAATAVHKGQVIEGGYHEWHEIFVERGGVRRLACIAMIAPRAEQLSAAAAGVLLARARGVGAPSRAQLQGSDVQLLAEPDGVRAEPLRRVRPDTENDGAAGRADAPPPLPASREAGETGAAPVPLPRERVNARPADPGDAAAGTESPAAVGVEDRRRVADTLVPPWNTIGQLSVTYPNGESFRCTGTLVSPYVVLTAGHCVHNKNRGGYAAQVRFYPAQYQTTLGDNAPRRPYGKTDFAFIRATEAWTQISDQESYPVTDYRHDFAAVQFKTPFTFTATFMPVVFGSSASPAVGSGYPGQVNGLGNYGQWYDEGLDTSSAFMRGNHVKQYALDASGGNSGGPFFAADAGGQSSLVGLLSYAEELNDRAGGPWYDSWNRTLLVDWMTWTPAAAAAAGGLGGLRVAGVFSSNHPTLFSYLRFYNDGPAPGTVEVTLADGATGAALGTWTSPAVPASGMLQVGIREVEAATSLPAAKPDFYSLSVRPSFTGYFQHAMHEPFTLTLTNLTSCDAGAAAQAGLVIGVHSTRIEGYPSSVVIHNTGVNAAAVALAIHDSRTGAELGRYNAGVIPGNGQRIVSAATLQASASTPWQPVEIDMAHYVVKLIGGSFFTGYLQHIVHNQPVDTVTDLSAVCRMAP